MSSHTHVFLELDPTHVRRVDDDYDPWYMTSWKHPGYEEHTYNTNDSGIKVTGVGGYSLFQSDDECDDQFRRDEEEYARRTQN